MASALFTPSAALSTPPSMPIDSSSARALLMPGLLLYLNSDFPCYPHHSLDVHYKMPRKRHSDYPRNVLAAPIVDKPCRAFVLADKL